MANFSDLHDFVLPYLPGAEPGVVDFHTRSILREFFKRTTVWRERFEFDTVVESNTYSLLPTAGAVSSILEVHIDGRHAPPLPENRRDPLVAPGMPRYWHSLLPQVITVYPAPTTAVPVQVLAALTVPVDGGDKTFPDDVLQAHAEEIAAGVVGAMMAMPGKPWTQREAAGYYTRIFGSALRDIRGKLRDGGQPNQSTFTSPFRFGA